MFEQVFLTILLIWLAIGLVLSLVMGRRGHAPFGWFLVGTALGPLALVLALTSWRAEEPRPRQLTASAASGSSGPVDALVGYDGSPEATAALDAVVGLLGSRLGRLTVATVIPHQAPAGEEKSAAAALETVCSPASRSAAGLEILRGLPSEALGHRAVEGGYQLLAVGTRGAGIAKAVFGSTASGLARTSKVPVLMVGAEVASRTT